MRSSESERERGTLKISTDSTVGAAADLAVMIFWQNLFLWERFYFVYV
jgi:hypothetical protein